MENTTNLFQACVWLEKKRGSHPPRRAGIEPLPRRIIVEHYSHSAEVTTPHPAARARSPLAKHAQSDKITTNLLQAAARRACLQACG